MKNIRNYATIKNESVKMDNEMKNTLRKEFQKNLIGIFIKNEFGKNLVGITDQVDIQIGEDDTRKEFGVLIDTSWGQSFGIYDFNASTKEIRSHAAQTVSMLMKMYGQDKGSYRFEMPSNFTIKK